MFVFPQRGAKKGESGYCPKESYGHIENPNEVAWPNATEVQLGKHAKQIFGKSWDFGPTGLTPPLPESWDSQKGKKK